MPRQRLLPSWPRASLLRCMILIGGTALLIGLGCALRPLTAGLNGWDHRTLAAITRWRDHGVVSAAHVVSLCGRSWVALPSALVIGWLTRRSSRRFVPAVAVLVAIVLQDVIKPIVARPRPPAQLHLEHVTSWSFPSGHALEATALSTGAVIAAWSLLRGVVSRVLVCALAAAWAGAVIAARLVLGVHFPTDVGAGLILGALSTALATTAAGWRDPRRGRRPQPLTVG